LKKRVTLSQLKADMWAAEHDEVILSFLRNTNLTVLIAYVDPNTGFHINTQAPAYKMEEMSYLIKQQGVQLTPQNIAKKLQFGTIKGNHIESLLRVMTNVYAPLIFGNKSWPVSILYIPSSLFFPTTNVKVNFLINAERNFAVFQFQVINANH
jgi:hypothetical protein